LRFLLLLVVAWCVIYFPIEGSGPMVCADEVKRYQELVGTDEEPITAGAKLQHRVFRVMRQDGHLLNFYDITTVHLDPRRFSAHLRTSADIGSSIQIATDNLRKRNINTFIILNGGYMRTFSEPIVPSGFVRVDGKQVNPPADSARDIILNGVVCLGAPGMKITEAPSVAEFNKILIEYEECLQAGPRLVIAGARQLPRELGDSLLHRFASEEYSRSFIFTTKRGEMVFGTTSPVALHDLVAVLLGEVDSSIRAENAIGLQGATSAGLNVYAEGKPVFSRGNLIAPQANMVIATGTDG